LFGNALRLCTIKENFLKSLAQSKIIGCEISNEFISWSVLVVNNQSEFFKFNFI